MGGWWSSIADEAIQKAMEQGAFENLSGSGQPLNLYQNPYEDPTMRSANRIMAQHGIAPDWIMERQSLVRAIERARTDLHQAWQRSQPGGRSWANAVHDFRKTLLSLNQRILTYNLKAPDTSVHVAPLVLEHEIDRVTNF